MTNNHWEEMSSVELKNAIRKICSTCSTAQEANERIRTTLGYPYHISICYGHNNYFQASFYDKDNEITGVSN